MNKSIIVPATAALLAGCAGEPAVHSLFPAEACGHMLRPITASSRGTSMNCAIAFGCGLLFAAASLVLIVACVNLAGLLLARGAGRAREFAIRTAVGASGFRLARQAFIEAMVMITLGGAAGVALGW